MAGNEEEERKARDSELGKSVLHALGVQGLEASRILLRDDSSGHAPLVNTQSAKKLRGAGSRYHVLGQIAQGGMGVVFKGRDVDLGRDVAMKVLHDQFKERGDIVQRFVEEAQIGGQLQHPGIVPVYEIGLQPDGRPYFTMKLVKGRTLTALLAEREDPSRGRRRFLRIFESVCQTLSYAHARGVIHRDLKPSNIMVGAFGQVLVVDWGLAKVRGHEEPAEPKKEESRAPADPMTVIATVRSKTTSADSMVGSVMGTPAYMSPEQARGEVDSLDERSDVFALGAILCEILTGEPPIAGTDVQAVIAVARGKLQGARERLDACGADPSLVELAKACLSPAVAARPPHAGAVADALAEYFAAGEERERAAREEEAAARVRAEEEKRSRRLTVVLAAAVAATLAVAGGGYLWMRLERAAQIEAGHRQVESALREATALQGSAAAAGSIDAWAKAVSAAKQAVTLAEAAEASEADLHRARRLLTSVTAERSKAVDAQANAERDRVTEHALDEVRVVALSGASELANARYAEVFQESGIDATTADPAAAWELVRESGIGVRLASGLADWARLRRSLGLPDASASNLALAIDPDPWRTMLRKASDEQGLKAIMDITALDNVSAAEMVELAAAHEEFGDPVAAGRILAAAVEIHPSEFWPRVHFADHLRRHRVVPQPPAGEADHLAQRARNLLGTYSAEPAWSEDALVPDFFSASFTTSQMKNVYADAFRTDGEPVRVEVLSRLSADSAVCEYEFPTGRVHTVWLSLERGAPYRLRAAAWRTMRDPAPGRLDRADWLTNHVATRHLTAATALRPESTAVHAWLAESLLEDLEPERAEAMLQLAERRAPEDPLVRMVRARVHLFHGRVSVAVELMRDIVRERPGSPLAHCRLGLALRQAGRLDEALRELRTGHDLATVRTRWNRPSGEWVAECERLNQLNARLDDYLTGRRAPEGERETIDLARLCEVRGEYVTAARLWEELFSLDLSMTDPVHAIRYEAARVACLASGEVRDRKEAARFLRRAVEWLGRELTNRQQFVTDDAVRGRLERGAAEARVAMRLWLLDPALAPIRDEDQVATLSDQQQGSIALLWSQVRDLLAASDS